jgi:hypothetical protein
MLLRILTTFSIVFQLRVENRIIEQKETEKTKVRL